MEKLKSFFPLWGKCRQFWRNTYFNGSSLGRCFVWGQEKSPLAALEALMAWCFGVPLECQNSVVEKGLETWISDTLCESLNDHTICLEGDHAAYFFSSTFFYDTHLFPKENWKNLDIPLFSLIIKFQKYFYLPEKRILFSDQF